MEENIYYDVIIIGGSYAGLSAALALGRAIRNVLIIDNDRPCNWQTPHSHNFLTQDGNTPAAIAEICKSQVMAYPTIQFLNDTVVNVQGGNNNFVVFTLAGEPRKAKKLLFTTGIKDLLPAIPGFSDSWGISVIHCPYCHGYEYKGQPTGILANGETAFEFGRLINNWTNQLTIFTNGESTISAAYYKLLAAMNIAVVEKRIKEIIHVDGYLNRLVFDNEEEHDLDALYARIPFEQHSYIPKELGCALTDSGHIQVDDFQKTTVPGIYAAGDNSTFLRAVTSAVAAGAKAGAFLNHELIAEN